MGLDFLLSDDQTNPSGEPENPPTPSTATDESRGHLPFASQQSTEHPDSSVSSSNPAEHPRSNELQISSTNHSVKRALSLSDSPDSDTKSFLTEPGSVPKSDLQSMTSNIQSDPALVDTHEQRQQNSRLSDDVQEISESAGKRIKLDPGLTPMKSETLDVKPGWNCVKADPDSINASMEELISNCSRSASIDGLNGDGMKASSDNSSSTFCDSSSISSCNTTGTTLKSDMPLIPTELDEDYTCAESIRALFAQIDRLEVFLDESYVRFVESFPCT
ncbi:unnamed protein product [Echinostoma caproni]|uniref:DUF4614 domain-containing protein n=1 Tax=Echinostoma caproni TaxID=27848 RepID=A0A183A7S1_9TREM|nr:unnamed protein product [Echinostoma caproni]